MKGSSSEYRAQLANALSAADHLRAKAIARLLMARDRLSVASAAIAETRDAYSFVRATVLSSVTAERRSEVMAEINSALESMVELERELQAARSEVGTAEAEAEKASRDYLAAIKRLDEALPRFEVAS